MELGYYQARLSIETARLLEKMRLFYEKKTGGSVSKGDCLIMAYSDSLWVEDWKKIFDELLPSTEKYEISPTAQLLKVQVSDDVKNGIQELKELLPQLIGTRSVTVGVCIREILKAAYIKNNSTSIEDKIRDIFDMERRNIQINLESNTNKKIIEILNTTESKILSILK
ncbi:hypothetical protein [Lactococcus garvieae]|uniref:hypothetical protein n=1 Tax=Lactococcus garvieae TaxID=1363 RepID=UPI00398EB382